jgi:hypothetical protein
LIYFLSLGGCEGRGGGGGGGGACGEKGGRKGKRVREKGQEHVKKLNLDPLSTV